MSNQAPQRNLESGSNAAELVAVDIVAYRKSLIPKWIKVFGWIFIVFGVAVPGMSLMLLVVGGGEVTYTIFGLESKGSAFNPPALLIQAIFILLAVTAYGLLFGKSWGLTACLANGYIGIGICVLTAAVGAMSGVIHIRLEPVVQVIYLYKLHQIRGKWSGPKEI